jgi:2-polyprenyl-6-methoxyphenol hydroxylase-like FAD-dependent oxidoreductase
MRVIIAGGGIGGLAAALALQARGIDAVVFERSATIRELGVGINTLPHAIGVLAGLGLLPALDAVAIRTHELIYANRHGQTVWRELRGVEAGHPVPQFSIHRGRLQGVLLAAVEQRLPGAVRCGHTLDSFADDGAGVTARFRLADGSLVTERGDVLVAADGIHSVVRAQFYPDQGPPLWNGIMLWRGAVPWAPFLTGRSMIIAGGMDGKLVLYPIAPEPDGRVLLNWAIMARVAPGGTAPPRREDWSRTGSLEELMPRVAGFHVQEVDVGSVVRATHEFYEYPVCDRDPVERWSWGRVTLLGDAAHPMYPVGSNGASQAILDANALATHLAEGTDPVAALAAYESERAPATAAIVRSNRLGGPERVIDLVDSRAPDGFLRLEDIASEEELRAVVGGYASMAGFARA